MFCTQILIFKKRITAAPIIFRFFFKFFSLILFSYEYTWTCCWCLPDWNSAAKMENWWSKCTILGVNENPGHNVTWTLWTMDILITSKNKTKPKSVTVIKFISYIQCFVNNPEQIHYYGTRVSAVCTLKHFLSFNVHNIIFPKNFFLLRP